MGHFLIFLLGLGLVSSSYADSLTVTASSFVDLNLDGREDLLFSTLEDRRELAFVNQGFGQYAFRNDLFPERDEGIVLFYVSADFLGDERTDLLALVTQDYQHSSLYLWEAVGEGRWIDRSELIEQRHFEGWAEWARVADFDSDGRPDFLLTSPGCSSCPAPRIYLHHEGRWGPSVIEFRDRLGSYMSESIWHDHAQNLLLESRRIEVPMTEAWVGDFNQDGKVDFFSTGQTSSWARFLNRSTPGQLIFDIEFFGGKTYECKDVKSCWNYLGLLWQKLWNPSLFPCKRENGRCGKLTEGLGPLYTPFESDVNFSRGVVMDTNGDGQLEIVGSAAIADEGRTVPIWIWDGKVLRALNGQVEWARQWLVFDANQDGLDDLFIADHGPDRPPYEGAPNRLFLNRGEDGLVNISAHGLGDVKRYTHGASAHGPLLFFNERLPLYQNHETVFEKEVFFRLDIDRLKE